MNQTLVENILNEALTPASIKRLQLQIVEENEMQIAQKPALFYNITRTDINNQTYDSWQNNDTIECILIDIAGADYFADFDENWEKIKQIEKVKNTSTYKTQNLNIELTEITNEIGNNKMKNLIVIKFVLNIQYHTERS